MDIFFIPRELDLEKALMENGLLVFNTPSFREKCHYLISSLYLETVIKGENWKAYHPRHSSWLKEVLTTKLYNDVKKILLELKIIEVQKEKGKESYQAGGHSKSYRIGEAYWDSKFVGVEANPKFVLKIRQKGQRRNESVIAVHPGKSLIYNSLYKLDFDELGAKKLFESFDFTSDHARNCWKHSISRMENRHFRISQDARGRVYHNLTNMPRKLREMVSYQEESLYMVDVSSSHFCFLSSFYPYRCTEKERYESMVRDGEFYKFLNSTLKFPFNLEIDEEKVKFKKNVFHYLLYSSNYVSEPDDLWKVFAAEFPILAERVRHEKRRHQRYLSHELQKLEAEIVINRAASKMAKKYPDGGICLISVHDCFITTEEHAKEVKNILLDEYERGIGFMPTVNINMIPPKFAAKATCFSK